MASMDVPQPSEEGMTATGIGTACPGERSHVEEPKAPRLIEDTALLPSRSRVCWDVWGDSKLIAMQ